MAKRFIHWRQTSKFDLAGILQVGRAVIPVGLIALALGIVVAVGGAVAFVSQGWMDIESAGPVPVQLILGGLVSLIFVILAGMVLAGLVWLVVWAVEAVRGAVVEEARNV